MSAYDGYDNFVVVILEGGCGCGCKFPRFTMSAYDGYDNFVVVILEIDLEIWIRENKYVFIFPFMDLYTFGKTDFHILRILHNSLLEEDCCMRCI